jgi:hypothetical protein
MNCTFNDNELKYININKNENKTKVKPFFYPYISEIDLINFDKTIYLGTSLKILWLINYISSQLKVQNYLIIYNFKFYESENVVKNYLKNNLNISDNDFPDNLKKLVNVRKRFVCKVIETLPNFIKKESSKKQILENAIDEVEKTLKSEIINNIYSQTNNKSLLILFQILQKIFKNGSNNLILPYKIVLKEKVNALALSFAFLSNNNNVWEIKEQIVLDSIINLNFDNFNINELKIEKLETGYKFLEELIIGSSNVGNTFQSLIGELIIEKNYNKKKFEELFPPSKLNLKLFKNGIEQQITAWPSEIAKSEIKLGNQIIKVDSLDSINNNDSSITYPTEDFKHDLSLSLKNLKSYISFGFKMKKIKKFKKIVKKINIIEKNCYQTSFSTPFVDKKLVVNKKRELYMEQIKIFLPNLSYFIRFHIELFLGNKIPKLKYLTEDDSELKKCLNPNFNEILVWVNEDNISELIGNENMFYINLAKDFLSLEISVEELDIIKNLLLKSLFFF